MKQTYKITLIAVDWKFGDICAVAKEFEKRINDRAGKFTGRVVAIQEEPEPKSQEEDDWI